MVFQSKGRTREEFDSSWDVVTAQPSRVYERIRRRRNRRVTNHSVDESRYRTLVAIPFTALLFGAALFVAIPGEIVRQSTNIYIRALTESSVPDVPSNWRHAAPSYQRVCTAILSRASPSETLDQSTKVYENMSLCLNTHDVSNSLANVFASTFLTHIASINGIDVHYEHKCFMRHLERDDASRQTVMQQLPKTIQVKENTAVGSVMQKESLLQLCEQVVDLSWDDAVSFAGVWTVMDHTLTTHKEPSDPPTEKYTVLEYMLPTIRESLAQAVRSWSRKGLQRSLVSTIGGYFVENFKDSATEIHGKVYPPEPVHYKSAIYLPCMDANCTDASILPYYEYYIHIPNNVKTLDILIPQNCFKNIGKCKQSANMLAKYMVELYPRAKVTLLRHGHDTSMEHFRRLYEADYALCGPGWGTMCLFPALARPPTTDGSRIIVMEQEDAKDTTTLSVLDSIQSPFDSHVKVVIPKQAKGHWEIGNAHNTYTLQNRSEGDTQCRKIRGRFGKWELDDEVANKAQYSVAMKHLWGKADRKYRNLIQSGLVAYDSFREATRYAWKDGQTLMMDDNGPSCSIEMMTPTGMCALMREMNLGRIFVLGDSLSLSQSLSLHQLVGMDGKIPWDEKRTRFKQTINCKIIPGETKPYSFILEVARNNLLLKMTPEEAFLYHTQPYQFAVQWEPRFLEDKARTLLIVNVGAHIKTLLQFEGTLDRFLSTIDKIESKRHYKDIIMWRTSVPGHWGCQEHHSRRPHKTYQDYAQKRDKFYLEASTYEWHLFEPLNDYAIRSIEARSLQPGAKAHIEILDVHPMTILRQDGHVMLDSNVETEPDCLHYSLPGPADWWNHLMYSNLLDIAADERALKVSNKNGQL